MVHHAFVFRIMYFELRKTFLATFLSSSLAYSSIERLLQTQEAKLHSQLEAFTVANLRLKLKCIISSSIVWDPFPLAFLYQNSICIMILSISIRL